MGGKADFLLPFFLHFVVVPLCVIIIIWVGSFNSTPETAKLVQPTSHN